mgnify:CR=1 FL=1
MATDMRIDTYEDYMDTRNILEYIEGLDAVEDKAERNLLVALIEEVRQMSGDTPEDGVQLIRASYFETYAEELAEDIGAIDRKLEGQWPYNHIDWKAAAEELMQDYTEIDFDGVTYWYR